MYQEEQKDQVTCAEVANSRLQEKTHMRSLWV
jgi:hypothetical protein